MTTQLTNCCYLGRAVLLSFHWANPIQRFLHERTVGGETAAALDIKNKPLISQQV